MSIRDRIRLLHVLAEYLGTTTLALATYDDLLGWQVTISSLATATVATYTTHVKRFYAWCVKPLRLLPISPAEDLIVPSQPRRKPRPVPEGDYQYALAGCVDDLVHTWLLLTRYAGLRCCELAWLRRDDVLDDSPPRLHVHGKGGHERMVFIPVELLDALSPWMRRQGHLFTSDNGRGFRPATISARIARHFDALGLPYTAHQLRHSYGTDAMKKTKNLRLVQAQMGHASPTTTAGYTEVDEPEAIELATALGADLRKHRRREG